jgi:hypothetical protein
MKWEKAKKPRECNRVLTKGNSEEKMRPRRLWQAYVGEPVATDCTMRRTFAAGKVCPMKSENPPPDRHGMIVDLPCVIRAFPKNL